MVFILKCSSCVFSCIHMGLLDPRSKLCSSSQRSHDDDIYVQNERKIKILPQSFRCNCSVNVLSLFMHLYSVHCAPSRCNRILLAKAIFLCVCKFFVFFFSLASRMASETLIFIGKGSNCGYCKHARCTHTHTQMQSQIRCCSLKRVRRRVKNDGKKLHATG